MAASVAEQILARVKAVLLNATSARRSVRRAPAGSLREADLPAIEIRRGGTEHQAASFENDQVTVGFEIDFLVSAADTEGGETAADALHLEAHALLVADATLETAGKATLRLASTSGEPDQGETAFYRLTARYEIDAWVLRADLTTLA